MDTSVWHRIRHSLRSLIPPHVYHSLVEPAQLTGEGETDLCLEFSDQFSKECFEEKCLPALKESLSALALADTPVRLSIGRAPLGPTAFEFAPVNPFDPKYTFDAYMVGSSNQFAHAACMAVSKQPGQCYNPLFIFGGAGLGKTHLLKAIGHALHEERRDLRIVFLTGESFANELISAIRVDRMREFRDKYRTRCDVLLLDDIHFLAGKERTQEEFFYTFNSLHEARKQIVITSDRYPKDIQGLENRLQTRFEWGLVADVQPPEIETRIAILQNKAEGEGIALPEAVAQYIATQHVASIRELEGTLHRLQAYATLSGVSITLDLAHKVMKDISPKSRHELTADGVLKLVALQFGVRTIDLKSDKRARKLSVPRQVCMYLLRKHLLMSFPEIGRFLGGKDHTTALHGVNKIAALQRTDPEILQHVSAIESLVR